MKLNINTYTKIIATVTLLVFTNCSQHRSNDFLSSFPKRISRTWIGPDYWANPLQDWKLNNGRIENIVSGGERNVVLLSREIKNIDGEFILSVEFGKLDTLLLKNEQGWVGFEIGIQGEFGDYRSAAVRGVGFPIGITTGKRLFIGEIDSTIVPIDFSFKFGKMVLNGYVKNNNSKLTLKLFDKNGKLISEIKKDSVDGGWINGLVAIVSHSGKLLQDVNAKRNFTYPNWGQKPGTERKGNMHFWFNNLYLTGNVIKKYPDRKFGPLLFSQYTLSKGVLKLTVQLPPIAKEDGKKVLFLIKEKKKWKNLQVAAIDSLSRTANFKITNWNYNKNIKYRLQYSLNLNEDKLTECYREGTIRKEPWDKDEIVIAAFTGNNDLGFPNNELVNAVKFHNPDLLFFSGDQIYEGVGGYGIQTDNIDNITLDYLRKWFLYGWAYGNLMKDRPAIALPDDHDVYHGNIWGAGGKATPKGLWGAYAQDAGGYKYFPEWINVVQKTQTSHLPDPFDPAPVKQGIGVYYCDMNYAGISFAIIEDRKFKSAPKVLLPKANVFNGWAQNKSFNAAKEGDVKNAVLLGERQLKFLNHWIADWSNKTWMKVLLSQTIFANVATLPKEKSHSDKSVPSLKIFDVGDYPPDDIPVQDMDSNGWPQTPRNKALEIIRKAFTFHIAGDQHLGSTIQYGINNWRDAGFAFCVPSISNVWPRRWFPSKVGKNRKPGMPRYTGDFKDGFGNFISVEAVSNPFVSGKKPSRLYDRATGYGIVKLNRKNRNIEIECWPRWVNPSNENAKQYPGWPITIAQMDNYKRKAVAYLPNLVVENMSNPVVQIINEATNEIVYIIRINGTEFKPYVFELGKYTIKIGEPDNNKQKILRNIVASNENKKEIKIKF